VLVLAVALGLIAHQQGWHQPLVDFAADPAFAVGALLHRSDLPSLQIDLRFEDYQVLVDQRAAALQLGAHVNLDDVGVPASITYTGGTAAVSMRLLEGPAGMFAEATWPFAVVVQGDGAPFDLHHFTLNPADDAALSSWGYLETLRRADLPAPRLQLVRLVVNGTPWGIYALEEVMTGSPAHPLVTFDPTAYWEVYPCQGNGFQYAEVAVDCGITLAGDDPALFAPCVEALELARSLRSGEIPPSAVFDSEQMSTFLALTALWQGASAPDWRTLRLAYDPQHAVFEPVGTAVRLEPSSSLPPVLLEDPTLQVATARALAEFGSPDTLAGMRDDLSGELEPLQMAVGGILGRIELPWEMLETHQAEMRRQVAPPRPLSARLEAEPGALVLVLRNTQPFPVELAGLDVGERSYLPVDPTLVDEADRGLLVGDLEGVVLRAAPASAERSVHLRIDLAALPATLASPEITIIARLWGFPDQHIPVPVRYDDPSWFLDQQGGAP
jgi:hypothetical protein